MEGGWDGEGGERISGREESKEERLGKNVWIVVTRERSEERRRRRRRGRELDKIAEGRGEERRVGGDELNDVTEVECTLGIGLAKVLCEGVCAVGRGEGGLGERGECSGGGRKRRCGRESG